LDSDEGDHGNYVSFDVAGPTVGWTNVTFSMDYSTLFTAADGFSVAFLDANIHGATGAIPAGATGLNDVEERGQYSNSIGVGFRTFNGTNATINYNGGRKRRCPLSSRQWWLGFP
jgi:hypothetical protein